MKGARRLHVLVFVGDGQRILRLALPRPLVYGVLAVLGLAVAGLAAVWGDYLALRREGEVTALRQLTDEQRGLIESVRDQIAEIQAEVATWRDLHARIWEPLGPEERGSGTRFGAGGGEPAAEPASGAGGVATELERLAVGVTEEGQKLRALSQLMGRAGKFLATLPSRWPVRGAVNSEFGRRISPFSGAPESHSGIDIAAAAGTPVTAPAPGVVLLAGRLDEYGSTVVIDHGHEIRTLFGHLQKPLVTPGQKVERGQQIALTGNSGKSSGPHLHYEISVRGRTVNPRAYLWD